MLPELRSWLPHPYKQPWGLTREDPPTVALNPLVGHTCHRCVSFYVATQ